MWSPLTRSTNSKGPVPTGFFEIRPPLSFIAFGRGHDPGPVREDGEERRERFAERHPHCVLVHRLDRLDGLYLCAADGVLFLVALEIELHGLGIEGGAVVELDAFSQLEGVGLTVVGDVVTLREYRYDLAVLRLCLRASRRGSPSPACRHKRSTGWDRAPAARPRGQPPVCSGGVLDCGAPSAAAPRHDGKKRDYQRHHDAYANTPDHPTDTPMIWLIPTFPVVFPGAGNVATNHALVNPPGMPP